MIMIRNLSFISVLGVLALPVQAQEGVIVGGVPTGVLIYDAMTVSEGSVVSAPLPTASGLIDPSTPFILSPEPAREAVQPIQSRASVRSTPVPSPVVNGTQLDPASVAAQIDLAPGETVLEAIAVSPSIIQIPAPQPVYTSRYEPSPAVRVTPPPKRDPVTGRLRDTPGWTGRREAPASIGCYPAGACAVLNAR